MKRVAHGAARPCAAPRSKSPRPFRPLQSQAIKFIVEKCILPRLQNHDRATQAIVGAAVARVRPRLEHKIRDQFRESVRQGKGVRGLNSSEAWADIFAELAEPMREALAHAKAQLQGPSWGD